jgi:hypothetical protein
MGVLRRWARLFLRYPSPPLNSHSPAVIGEVPPPAPSADLFREGPTPYPLDIYASTDEAGSCEHPNPFITSSQRINEKQVPQPLLSFEMLDVLQNRRTLGYKEEIYKNPISKSARLLTAPSKGEMGLSLRNNDYRLD